MVTGLSQEISDSSFCVFNELLWSSAWWLMLCLVSCVFQFCRSFICLCLLSVWCFVCLSLSIGACWKDVWVYCDLCLKNLSTYCEDLVKSFLVLTIIVVLLLVALEVQEEPLVVMLQLAIAVHKNNKKTKNIKRQSKRNRLMPVWSKIDYAIVISFISEISLNPTFVCVILLYDTHKRKHTHTHT